MESKFEPISETTEELDNPDIETLNKQFDHAIEVIKARNPDNLQFAVISVGHVKEDNPDQLEVAALIGGSESQIVVGLCQLVRKVVQRNPLTSIVFVNAITEEMKALEHSNRSLKVDEGTGKVSVESDPPKTLH